MVRLAGASEPIREAVPAELVPLFWAITLFGSAKFLVLALSLAYWNLEDHRDRLLALISVAFVALTLTLVLKQGLDMPRPPESVQRYPVETGDVGFPSGHAIAATVVYGGAVVALGRVRDRRAVAAAGVLVVLVSLSRVVLGVHYLGDVLAGAAVGLVALGAVAAVVERNAVYGFGAAALLSVPGLVVTGGSPDAALALGGSLGGVAGTLGRSSSAGFRTTAERALLNAGGVVLVCIAGGLSVVLDGVVPALVVVNVLLVAGIVALPAALGTVDRLGPSPGTN